MGRTSEPIDDDLAVLAAVAFVVFANLCAWSMFADGDTGWHLAAGNWMLANLRIPTVDVFSYTFAGQPWIAHEWLAEIPMSLAWQAAGWSGLSLLFALAGTATFLILGLELRRWLGSLAVFVALLAVFVVLQPFMLARPHMLLWPAVALWTAMLLRAREERRAPRWRWALLMLVWANAHGSFLFGLLLIGPFALEALIEKRDWPTLRGWAAFGLLCLGLCFATPHGPSGLLFPLQVSTLGLLPLITEWRATDFSRLSGFSIVLMAVLALLRVKGVRLRPLRALLLMALLLLALQHIRHQTILALVGVLLLAEPLGRSLAPDSVLPKPDLWAALAGRWPRYRLAAALLAALLLLVAATRIAVPMQRPESAEAPLRAIAAVPSELRGRPVFNSYGFGGALILAGHRPYIDGRADLYGDAFVMQFHRASMGHPRSWRDIQKRWDIEWAILKPEQPIARLLLRQPGWRAIYRDDRAVILRRMTTP